MGVTVAEDAPLTLDSDHPKQQQTRARTWTLEALGVSAAKLIGSPRPHSPDEDISGGDTDDEAEEEQQLRPNSTKPSQMNVITGDVPKAERLEEVAAFWRTLSIADSLTKSGLRPCLWCRTVFLNMTLVQWIKLLWILGDSLFDGIEVWSWGSAQLIISLALTSFSCLFVSLLGFIECLLFWWPLRIFRFLTGKGLSVVKQVNPRPIFIIGHYRSGTTLLHNLFVVDKEHLTFTSGTQVVFPNTFLFHSVFVPLYNAMGCIPAKRPFDNVPLKMSKAQEDEVAISLMSGGMSPFLQFFLMEERQRRCFESFSTFKECPTYARRKLSKDSAGAPLDATCLEEGKPEADRSAKEILSHGAGKSWGRAFVTFLWKVTAVRGSKKRLVLKSPAHTARIPLILELFPEAQFVFVHRHPFEVWRSTLNMLQKTNLKMGIGPVPTPQECFEFVSKQYSSLVREYINTRHLVPEGNLVEVRYSDLIMDPTKVIRDTYAKLNMGCEPPIERLQKYEGKNHKAFQKNNFDDLPEEIKERLRREWADIFQTFGYE